MKKHQLFVGLLLLALSLTLCGTGQSSAAISATSQIEAEAFSSQSGIQLETCSDTGGGSDIGYIQNGDYVVYSGVDFGSGVSGFKVRAASANSGGTIEIRLDSLTGTLAGTCAVPGTGGWQAWSTVSSSISKVSGVHDLYLKFTGGSQDLMNVNWFTFVTGTVSAFDQIEAEAFSSQSEIQTETCSDSGGGQNIGYIQNGDYVVYSNVDFGAGATSFALRAASANSGGNVELHLDSLNGTLVGTCVVPGTGGWQSWTTQTCQISKVSGVHDLYLKFTGGSQDLMNVNWFKFGVSDPTPGEHYMEIMTWVPSYSQSTWKNALQANTGGSYHPRNTLTRLGAQFFQVKSNGGVTQGVSDGDLQWVANYCKTNQIKFLLCIHNYDNGGTDNWNWNLAVSAFANNRTTLINNLMNLVTKWQADGIDIDFEGNEAGDPYRKEFATFIKELGTRLHAQNKELTVDVFPNIWNQPNSNWWPDWVGYVDGVNSMGYDALFGGGSDWQAYRWQQETALNAGYKNYQFSMGMPGWLGTWGNGGMGTSVMAHLNELRSGNYNRQPTSVCIWDGQFNGNGWLSADVWNALHSIRTTKGN